MEYFFTLFSEQIFSDFLHWRLFCNFLTCEVMCKYPFFSLLVWCQEIELNQTKTAQENPPFFLVFLSINEQKKLLFNSKH